MGESGDGVGPLRRFPLPGAARTPAANGTLSRGQGHSERRFKFVCIEPPLLVDAIRARDLKIPPGFIGCLVNHRSEGKHVLGGEAQEVAQGRTQMDAVLVLDMPLYPP